MGRATNIGKEDGDLSGFSAKVQGLRISNKLVDDAGMHVAPKDVANFLCLGLGALDISTVINDKRHADGGSRLLIAQGGDMQVQVDRATTWNTTIDRMGDNRAMLVLQGSMLQQFGQANLWQRLKDFLVVLSHYLGRVQAQDVAGGEVKGSDDAGRVRGDDAVCHRGKDVIHVLLIFVDFAEEPGIIDGNGGLIAEGEQQIEGLLVEQAGMLAAIYVHSSDAVATHK